MDASREAKGEGLRDIFVEIGRFRPDPKELIAFVPLPGTNRDKNVIYAYLYQDRIVCFGQTTRSASARNARIATWISQRIGRGEPLSGASWQLYTAIEAGHSVSVWTGPSLFEAPSSQVRALRRGLMERYRTIHPHGWNCYRIPK